MSLFYHISCPACGTRFAVRIAFVKAAAPRDYFICGAFTPRGRCSTRIEAQSVAPLEYKQSHPASAYRENADRILGETT